MRRSTRRKILEQVEGTVSLSREGYGFIILPDREDDVYVPAKRMLGALNGDKVIVAITKAKDAHHKMEGEIVSIL